MSDSRTLCNESTFTELKDEYLSETFDSSIDYRKLYLQNEKYRQELYELQLKHTHNEAMQKELQEANELLEQSLIKEKEKAEKKIQEIQNKNREIQEAYEIQLNNFTMELEKKEKRNKELHNMLIQYKTEISQTTLCKPDHIEEKLAPLKQQMEELLISLEDERRKKEEAEEMNTNLNNQLSELQEILQVTKDNLREKNEILEDTREQLAICRTEIEALRTVPTSEICKGNSLFAEVEDRRQVALNKAVTLKKKYDEMKQAYKGKLEEIKFLKMEKSAILKKWDECVNIFSEDNDELIIKYKNRIRELENKLTEMQRNTVEIKTADTSFSYLESLLAEKKKEIQELHQKLERDSVDMLFQTEIKQKLTKQLRYWQCKAMHMEAQLSAIKSQLELEHANSPEYALFFEAVEKYKTAYTDFPHEVETTAECKDKIEKDKLELATLKHKSSVPYKKFENMLQRISNTDTSLKITNTGEPTASNRDCKADKSSNINKSSLDYDISNTSVCEDTNGMQNKEIKTNTLPWLSEKQKSQKIVHFSADTTSSTSDSMIKKTQNEEKKKVMGQYKIMYISSESK